MPTTLPIKVEMRDEELEIIRKRFEIYRTIVAEYREALEIFCSAYPIYRSTGGINNVVELHIDRDRYERARAVLYGDTEDGE